jgi:hypothetical protein
MLCLILIVGGLLIMMGQHDRSEALFYYFRLEDHIPENHLLRLIDKHTRMAFDFYSKKAGISTKSGGVLGFPTTSMACIGSGFIQCTLQVPG